uniref:Uncharacterized protein n=1 Tax=Aegilops tauschii subsp. strangulata TaxID=200361 RepID=A0A453BBQ5_AEGTS
MCYSSTSIYWRFLTKSTCYIVEWGQRNLIIILDKPIKSTLTFMKLVNPSFDKSETYTQYTLKFICI